MWVFLFLEVELNIREFFLSKCIIFPSIQLFFIKRSPIGDTNLAQLVENSLFDVEMSGFKFWCLFSKVINQSLKLMICH